MGLMLIMSLLSQMIMVAWTTCNLHIKTTTSMVDRSNNDYHLGHTAHVVSVRQEGWNKSVPLLQQFQSRLC